MDWAAAVQGVLSCDASERSAAEGAIAACDAEDAAVLVEAVATGRLQGRNLPLHAREAAAVLLVPVLLGDESGLLNTGRLWDMPESKQDRVCLDLFRAAVSPNACRTMPRLHAHIAAALGAIAIEYGEEWPVLKRACLEALQTPQQGDGLVTCLLIAQSAPEPIVAMLGSDEEVALLAAAFTRAFREDLGLPEARLATTAITSLAALGPYILGQDRHHFLPLATSIAHALRTCAQTSHASLATFLAALTDACMESAYVFRTALGEIIHILLTLIDAPSLPEETRVLSLEALAVLCESLPFLVRALRDGAAVPVILETIMRTLVTTLPDDAPVDVLQDGGESSPCAAASAAVLGRLAAPECLGSDVVGPPLLQLVKQCMEVTTWKPPVAGLEAAAQLIDARCQETSSTSLLPRPSVQSSANGPLLTTEQLLTFSRDWIMSAVGQHSDTRVHYSAMACLGTLASHVESLECMPDFWRSVGQITAAGMANSDPSLQCCACQVMEVFAASHGHLLSDLTGFEVVLRKLHGIVASARPSPSLWHAALDAAAALAAARGAGDLVRAQYAEWAATLSHFALAQDSPCKIEDRLKAAICLASFCKAAGSSRTMHEVSTLFDWARQTAGQFDPASPSAVDALALWGALIDATQTHSASDVRAIFDLAQHVLSHDLQRAHALEAQGLSASTQTESCRESVAAWNLLSSLARHTSADAVLPHADTVFSLARATMQLDLTPDIHVAAADTLSQLSMRAPANAPATRDLVRATLDLLMQALAAAEEDPELQITLAQVVQGLIRDGAPLCMPDASRLCEQVLQRFQESRQARAVMLSQARLYFEPNSSSEDVQMKLALEANFAFGRLYRTELARCFIAVARTAPSAYLDVFHEQICSAMLELARPHRLVEDRLEGLAVLAEAPLAASDNSLLQIVQVIEANLKELRSQNDPREPHLNVFRMGCAGLRCAVPVCGQSLGHRRTSKYVKCYANITATSFGTSLS
ncbi:Hypothetical Protein FCC1311_059432 [Hondaea fermentalgiana]|uniref:Uncharacterized protein n=1 Tax=Hondaea fermentalgiana TaxID=2315210 RepID=A0A2R5GFN2_9STRA|nr:Hypothetical Protein FCC1311_059432 [Hondaea fermentalgiana]|eukprot:GBG29722.1 Hypothetical Protein FCC1311_059432 [Hondaea fermentalgiana]